MNKNPVYWNSYSCPECWYMWEDSWDAKCDDDCPSCGKRNISPYGSCLIDEEIAKDKQP